MRDYGKVAPTFWTGSTGKSLRDDRDAQVLALYLMTCPMSHMTGVFHCPIVYMAHETGMTLEGASKALQRLIEGSFCLYDRDSEAVFVIRMAAYQVADRLVSTDKRVVGLRKDVEAMPKGLIRESFIFEYNDLFCLGYEAPSKPLRSQEQEQEQEQPQEQDAGTGLAKQAKAKSRGTRLPTDWSPSAEESAWAIAEAPGLNVAREASTFVDYWTAKPGADGVKLDWAATWRNWIRRSSSQRTMRPTNGKPPIAQNFSQKTYTGTTDDELPDLLRG